jgi:pimeloyl-ACP methyl ester carboxylesterase
MRFIDTVTTSVSSTATIREHELKQIERANETVLEPVVFVHGLWLLTSSWDRWVTMFWDAGYVGLTPDWPDDLEVVAKANAHPETFAHKSIDQVVDHFEKIIRALKRKPVIIGHSFGGLIAQILAGRGLASATVAIDPAPFHGMLPLPISSLKAAFPVLGNPENRNRAVPLTLEQFRFAFANAVSEEEADELYKTFAVPASGMPLVQDATSNLNQWTETKVDTENPERGPLLFVSGEKDNTVPSAIAHESFKQQQKNPGETEIVEVPNRGHSLTIDGGWQEVADITLAFVRRFVPTGPIVNIGL